MGMMFVQALSRFYTSNLIAIDIVEKRLQLAKSLGTDLTYNPKEIPASELIAKLKAFPIDVVFDCSGKPDGLNLATKIVRRGGHINLFGCIREEVTISGSEWHGGAFNLVSSSPGAKIRDTFPPAIRMLERGHIDLRPLVTHIVPLADYPAPSQRSNKWRWQLHQGGRSGDLIAIQAVFKALLHEGALNNNVIPSPTSGGVPLSVYSSHPCCKNYQAKCHLHERRSDRPSLRERVGIAYQC